MPENVLISLVDDDESIRKATKRLIESVGLHVEDFASAEEYLLSGRPQDSVCLILDLRLPGISGLELQSRLLAFNCSVPIVFITAHGEEQVRTRALEAGAVDFLQKPFTENSLFRAINPFVDGRLGNDEAKPARTRERVSRFGFEQIVGRSPAMQEMLRLANRVAS